MYKLEYPYNEVDKINFIVEYNHKLGLKIETVDNYIEVVVETENIEDETLTETRTENYLTYYALEANEIIVNGEVVIDPDYEEKEAQKERERIAMLSLTRGDVFRALFQAKGITRAQIRALIENNELISEAQRELALIDFDEALNFYRGNTLIDTLGLALGITSEQMTKFFETNDYTVLLDDTENN